MTSSKQHPANPIDLPPTDRTPADATPHDGDWAQRGVTPRTAQGIGWVVVADEAIARILTTNDVPGTLDAVEALTDPAAHAKEGDLHVNDAGRRGGRVSHESGNSGSAKSSASVTSSAGEASQHLEGRKFARRLAAHLSDALRQKRYATLSIVAAPRFLGLLRPELDAAVKAAVVKELDKELTHASDDEIAKRLFGGPSASPPTA